MSDVEVEDITQDVLAKQTADLNSLDEDSPVWIKDTSLEEEDSQACSAMPAPDPSPSNGGVTPLPQNKKRKRVRPPSTPTAQMSQYTWTPAKVHNSRVCTVMPAPHPSDGGVTPLPQRKKRKRGRPPSSTRQPLQQRICRRIPTPLVVGRRTRMSEKVAECIDNCKENVAEIVRRKKNLQREIEQCDKAIEVQHQKAAHAASAVSINMVDAFKTKRSQEARRRHVKGKPRRKMRRGARVEYTRQHLRNALEYLVEGHKSEHATKSDARAATSVRRAARLYMDGKHVTLGRILKKHDVIEKIKSMSR